jgi:hypothetical protein
MITDLPIIRVQTLMSVLAKGDTENNFVSGFEVLTAVVTNVAIFWVSWLAPSWFLAEPTFDSEDRGETFPETSVHIPTTLH